MEDCRSILTRFPERAFDIRRRCARDAHFRSICADYEDAARAYDYWRRMALENDQISEASLKVEEYGSFLGELEAEILAHLNHSMTGAPQA